MLKRIFWRIALGEDSGFASARRSESEVSDSIHRRVESGTQIRAFLLEYVQRACEIRVQSVIYIMVSRVLG